MVYGKWHMVAEVAELLSVTVNTVRAWLRTGKLRGVKLPGGDWRVRQEDLDAMLNVKSRSGNPPLP